MTNMDMDSIERMPPCFVVLHARESRALKSVIVPRVVNLWHVVDFRARDDASLGHTTNGEGTIVHTSRGVLDVTETYEDLAYLVGALEELIPRQRLYKTRQSTAEFAKELASLNIFPLEALAECFNLSWKELSQEARDAWTEETRQADESNP